MSLKKALLAATILSLPLAAQAQPVSGIYIAAGAGVNLKQESKDTVGGAAGAFLRAGNPGGDRVVTKFEPGWAGVASIGYGFGNGLRLEVEGNFRENDVSDFRFGNVNPRLQSGRSRTYGVMGNVLYDFVIPGVPVMPYVGAGAGYAWSEYDGVSGVDYTGPNGRRLLVDDVDSRFAYQGIAGVAFPLGVPGLALTAEYRFLGTLSPQFDARLQTQTNAQAALGQRTNIAANSRLEADNFNHSILVGLRYAFNAPRPVAPVVVPQAPAVQPAPARTYLVFFDFDRADLTDRARQIIGEAAQAVNTTGTTRIEVAGHADRSGTPQYNQRLSQRRAEAVAAELSRRGIARNQMSIQAFGESRPLVPTADGVREPQNRRVEIVLR
ncbi:OmpA family protein [Muricoccus aerilatus]|nr:OmpA family protein [Roseomonas aerilata]